MDNRSNVKHFRRYNSYTSWFNTNIIYIRNPWVIAWWSAAFPGFGHLNLGFSPKALLLIVWELVINSNAGINKAMVYTFTGRFEDAKAALNERWLLLYIPVYLYCIWDSYRKTVDLNKHYWLAEKENAPATLFNMNGITLNLLEKRSPNIAMIWSMMFPGLGHLYLHRLPTGVFIVFFCILIAYNSHLVESIVYMLAGSLEKAKAVLDLEWTCFYPSMACFSAYEAYQIAVHQNRLFEKEQARYFRSHYGIRNLALLESSGSEGS